MNELSIEEFINKVSSRPGMYVFSEGVTELQGLFRGYYLARQDVESRDILQEFTNWLKEEKYSEFKDVSVGWARMILFYFPCEKRAMEEFFTLWGEYSSR